MQVFFLMNVSAVLADNGYKIGGAECERTDPNGFCVTGYSCQPSQSKPEKYLCQPDKIGGAECDLIDVNGNPAPNGFCVTGYTCKPSQSKPSKSLCQPTATSDIFGRIQPPDIIAGFLKNNPTGSGAISDFLSRLIVLIYSLAGIVLIFMILWGAFEWMMSGGDKEKIASARGRIMNAFIGILLFAIAFAVIRVLGTFTGFTFFAGQNDVKPAVIIRVGSDRFGPVDCSNGRTIFTDRRDNAVCNEK